MSMARDIPTEAEVLSWYQTLSNWGRWGPDDELGTLNLITAAKRQQAVGVVREGMLISCARTVRYQPTPDGPLPPRHFMLQSGEGEPTVRVGRSNATDAFLIAPHGFTITHLDAPSHTFIRTDPNSPWTMYNGKPRQLVKTVEGATAGLIELAAGGIVSRGVLLDVARLRGVPWLEPTDPLFPEDLEAAETAQGVRVEPGDILFVRTGFPRRRAELGPRPSSEGACGFQAACLPWLRQRDVALIATDTANDVAPPQYPGLGANGAVHGVGMGALGLWLLDNPDFEELGAACAERQRWEFMATIAPLKLEHGTGSPVNPLAML
jgi:kynurenine formamidase